MFEKGSYVVNTNNGICEINDVDDRYFKLAEKQLYSELAFTLGVQKSELNAIIEQHIG